ncbi:tetratricopeptide repeat protein [Tardiphaga sp. 804_B3_N1_9]|uniref:tetratricopeptide repeat protein n=1 Tax=Tardiphaga TaxID=1395974 RepID=UPI001585E919|nr:tetratricopeptide repeat protein [Tardiphaga robiniae]NUU39917.1 tetratricopeptide repeat protein [Tardiphaga robiniae]
MFRKETGNCVERVEPDHTWMLGIEQSGRDARPQKQIRCARSPLGENPDRVIPHIIFVSTPARPLRALPLSNLSANAADQVATLSRSSRIRARYMHPNARFGLYSRLFQQLFIRSPYRLPFCSTLMAMALAASAAVAPTYAVGATLAGPGGDYAACLADGSAKAMAACDRSIGLNYYFGRDLALLHVARSVKHQLNDNLDAAMTEAEAALRADPGAAFSFSTRGDVWQLKGDDERAIADFADAIRLAPQDPDYYIRRAKALNRDGQYDRAIADFDAAIRLDPSDAESIFRRGAAWDDKGDLDRALADYDMAIRMQPEFAVAYNNRALIFYGRNELDRAIADLDIAIQLNPDAPLFYVNRAETLVDKHDLVRAIGDYSTALRLQPDNVMALYRRGLQKQQIGDTAGGDADIVEAARLDPAWVAKQTARKA